MWHNCVFFFFLWNESYVSMNKMSWVVAEWSFSSLLWSRLGLKPSLSSLKWVLWSSMRVKLAGVYLLMLCLRIYVPFHQHLPWTCMACNEGYLYLYLIVTKVCWVLRTVEIKLRKTFLLSAWSHYKRKQYFTIMSIMHTTNNTAIETTFQNAKWERMIRKWRWETSQQPKDGKYEEKWKETSTLPQSHV